MKLLDRLRRVPWSMVLPAILLVGMGWLAIGRAEALSQKIDSAQNVKTIQRNSDRSDSSLGGQDIPHRVSNENRRAYLPRQQFFSGLAVFVAIAVALPNSRHYARFSYAIFAVALGFLVLVFFFPSINGSHRWIRIGSMGLQPSEFAKIAFIVAMARYLSDPEKRDRVRDLLKPVLMTLVPVLLILLEPDLGMALVFFPVLFVMLYVAGTRFRALVALVLVGLLLVPVLWTQMSREQRSRVVALFEQPSPGTPVSDDAWHLVQAKQMRAMGGVWGSFWSGSSTDDASVLNLPESRTDFIVCVWAERFGLMGFAVLLGTYAFFIWRATAISVGADGFGRLTVLGIVSLLAVEVLINTGMSVGLLPITGLALPFLSYGGSNLLAHALAVGLLVNIGIHSEVKPVEMPCGQQTE